jgi:hypothetical protein
MDKLKMQGKQLPFVKSFCFGWAPFVKFLTCEIFLEDHVREKVDTRGVHLDLWFCYICFFFFGSPEQLLCVLWIPWRTDIYEAKAALLACIKVKRKVIWFLKVMLLPLNVLEFNGKFSYLFLIGLANIKRLPISFCFCYCYILLVKREVNIAPYLIKNLFYKK